MKHLMNLKLFSLLTSKMEGDYVANEVIEAYEEFAVKIFEKLKLESDISELYYNLGFIRLELVGLRDNRSDKMEKKCIDTYQ